MAEKQKSNISPTQRLTESGIMLALAVVLNEFPVFEMPMGGGVTLFSQLPIVLIGYRHGVKWGLFTGLAMGIIEMLFGLKNFSYVHGIVAYLVVALADYIIAFGVLGLGGLFRNKVKNQALALTLGGILVSALRFACHFVSGVTVWADYADGAAAVWMYSLTYNGGYMLAEMILTVIGAAALGSIFDFKSPRLRPLSR